MLYNILKNIVINKDYNGIHAEEKEDMLNKLDIFFTFNRISVEQYQELLGMVNGTTTTQSTTA